LGSRTKSGSAPDYAAGVPDAVAPPPHHPRFPLIDGMRAIAALSVLLVHVAGASGAADPSLSGRLLAHLNVGVTIFFVISGFLLYRPFIAERGGGAAPPRVASFAKRSPSSQSSSTSVPGCRPPRAGSGER
jgi:Predicted acyltransferases